MREFKNNTKRTKSPVGYKETELKRSLGLVHPGVTNISPWGRLMGLLVFILLALTTNAQPLPPTTPNGNPVPVEGLFFLLPMALAVFGIFKLKQNRK